MTTLNTTPRVDRVSNSPHIYGRFQNIFGCSNSECSKHNFCLLQSSLSGGSWNTWSLFRITCTAGTYLLIHAYILVPVYAFSIWILCTDYIFIYLMFYGIPQYDWFVHNKHEVSICLRVWHDTRKAKSSSHSFFEDRIKVVNFYVIWSLMRTWRDASLAIIYHIYHKYVIPFALFKILTLDSLPKSI